MKTETLIARKEAQLKRVSSDLDDLRMRLAEERRHYEDGACVRLNTGARCKILMLKEHSPIAYMVLKINSDRTVYETWEPETDISGRLSGSYLAQFEKELEIGRLIGELEI